MCISKNENISINQNNIRHLQILFLDKPALPKIMKQTGWFLKSKWGEQSTLHRAVKLVMDFEKAIRIGCLGKRKRFFYLQNNPSYFCQ